MKTIESLVIRRRALAVLRRESDSREQQFEWPPTSDDMVAAVESFANGAALHLVRFESKVSFEVQRDDCFGGNPRGKDGGERLDGLILQAGSVWEGRT